MQEMFIMFQKGNPVPWPYIPFRSLTSCYQWPFLHAVAVMYSHGLGWNYSPSDTSVSDCSLTSFHLIHSVFNLVKTNSPLALPILICEEKGFSSLLLKTWFHSPSKQHDLANVSNSFYLISFSFFLAKPQAGNFSDEMVKVHWEKKNHTCIQNFISFRFKTVNLKSAWQLICICLVNSYFYPTNDKDSLNEWQTLDRFLWALS